MKNRLSMLAAGTFLSAAAAMPAMAGYTIYEDKALPSVLFVEFDDSVRNDASVVPAPGGAVTSTSPGSANETTSNDGAGDRGGDDRGDDSEREEASAQNDDDRFGADIDEAIQVDV